MTSQTTTRGIDVRAGKRVRLLALTLGTILAAQVTLVPVTEREARAVSTEKIVFDSNRTTGQGVNNPTGDSEIFKMTPDGTGLKQLTTNKVNDYRPALSTDGRKVVYTSKGIQTSNPQGEEDVYVMNVLDGTGKKNLSNTRAGANDDFPVFSPDGKTVAYESDGKQASNLQGDDEVYRVNVMDGTKKNLTNNGVDVDDYNPVFSPGGKRIAYASYGFQNSNQGSDEEIYTMRSLDGSDKKNVTNNAAGVDDYGPAYSPDGTKIAYQSLGIQFPNPEGDGEVFVMNASDGSGQTNLTYNGAEVLDGYPVFSPGGKKVAYESSGVQISNPDGDREVFVMNASDGSGQTNLTYNGDGVEDYEAEFSPDGTKVAYQSYGVQGSNSEGDLEIHVVNALNGTGQKNLTNNGIGVDDFAPDWGRQAP